MAIKPKAPKMSDIAKLVGVSTMTVSRALKPGTSVSRQTRQQVQRAAEELGYVLNSSAAGLSSRRTGFVAVIIPSINNANFADTLRGLTEKLRGSRLQILLGYTDYNVSREERTIEQFLSRQPEAIVVTGGSHTERSRYLLSHANVPVVEMWDLPKPPIDRVVGFSNANTSKLMVRHLHEQGYRKIAFIGGDAERDTRGLDRRRGFIKEMKKRDLDSSRLVAMGHPPISMREGAWAMQRLLAEWSDTDAVMCVSDLSAYGAMTECLRLGLSVPRDMAVAGFGDYDLAEYAAPSITTVNVNPLKIGELVASTILSELGLEGAERKHHIIKTTAKLIVRESTLRS